jgi:2-polyprenyl-3-methyl-5-hydroxy-6-metoxy-1,4-benzoquinol methylase
MTKCQNCGDDAAEWSAILGAGANTECCSRCGGWAFRGEIPQSAEEIYDEHYFNGGEYFAYDEAPDVLLLNFRRKLRLLQGLGLPSPLRVLEIGCATGQFLQTLKQQLPDATMCGIEASRYCRERAAERGFEVLAPERAEAAVRDLRPNLIVAWDVWEHLREPASIFDEILSHADTRCVVAMTTVDASSLVARVRGKKWRQFHPPTHLNYPTRISLRRYLESRRFSIRHHRSFGYYRPIGEYVRAVVPAAAQLKTQLMNLPAYLNLYDTQLIVGDRANGPSHTA